MTEHQHTDAYRVVEEEVTIQSAKEAVVVSEKPDTEDQVAAMREADEAMQQADAAVAAVASESEEEQVSLETYEVDRVEEVIVVEESGQE